MKIWVLVNLNAWRPLLLAELCSPQMLKPWCPEPLNVTAFGGSLSRGDEGIRRACGWARVHEKRGVGHRPHRDTGGRQPFKRQGRRPQKKLTLLTPCCQTSSLCSCKEINFCCSSHPFCGLIYGSPRKQIHSLLYRFLNLGLECLLSQHFDYISLHQSHWHFTPVFLLGPSSLVCPHFTLHTWHSRPQRWDARRFLHLRGSPPYGFIHIYTFFAWNVLCSLVYLGSSL